MKLPEILRADQGVPHVWLFTRHTNVKTIADAHRRVQAAIARPPHDKIVVECQGVIVTNHTTYEAEPALIITAFTKA